MILSPNETTELKRIINIAYQKGMDISRQRAIMLHIVDLIVKLETKIDNNYRMLKP